VSVVNLYRKVRQRVTALREKGMDVVECEEKPLFV